MDYYFHDIAREGNIDMTFEQIELVQKAWGRVSALNNSYVQEVYEELFRLSPELRTLFPPHQELPVAKVSDTLNTIITSLSPAGCTGFHHSRSRQASPAIQRSMRCSNRPYL